MATVQITEKTFEANTEEEARLAAAFGVTVATASTGGA